MLLSTLFFSLMNVCVKLVSHIPAIEVILFRSIVSLVMSYVVLQSTWPVMDRYLRTWALFVRGLVEAGSDTFAENNRGDSHTVVKGVPGPRSIRGASPRCFFLGNSSTRVSLSPCPC
jgi:hypothetical protein